MQGLDAPDPLSCVCSDTERVPLPWLQEPILSFFAEIERTIFRLQSTIFY
jgi:hypothetical protein